VLFAAQPAPACGPFFPNNLLDRGDTSLFVAPEADFGRELERMKLARSRFEAKPLQGEARPTTQADQSLDAEIGDLLTALQKSKLPPEEVGRIRAAHQKARDALRRYTADCEVWRRTGEWNCDHAVRYREEPKAPAPKFPQIEIVSGLPGEFADYFEGALAWHNPALVDKGLAREAWERLLERPAAERKFKSTWAAFMLGKSWEDEDPDTALDYFKQVRDLAKHGFADSLGLAAASLGLEARIHLDLGEYDRAIELYLEQFATQDPTAVNSLRQVAREVLTDASERVQSLLAVNSGKLLAGEDSSSGEDNSLARLAAQPKAQRVITAFLVSRHRPGWDTEHNAQVDSQAARWLAAVEAADVREVDSAEKLALAAYQAGEIELAQRWIKRAPESPVAQWLQAKLLLRAGKVEPAAALLAKVSRSFPAESPDPKPPGCFAECLHVITGDCDVTTAPRQILGELGALHLARRQFIEALDALLHSDYWLDAAYVAERVLTVDELKAYVDANWPFVPQAEITNTNEPPADASVAGPQRTERIRYLLARRLTRLNRGAEAREFFPAKWQPQYDALMRALNAGWDETQSTNQRATALFTAAVMTRTNGMELLGTEVEPDWHVHDGNFEFELTARHRANKELGALRATPEELRRAFTHKADPEQRFHYRYQAAFLAWEAAKLMPNNADETARVLCTAGSWLKARDPDTADIFYKALVRRCRKTAIGAQADWMRWFPVLDAEGNPKPYKSRLDEMTPPKLDEPAPAIEDDSQANVPVPVEGNAEAEMARDYPLPGKWYVLRYGDDLNAVARAVRRLGVEITVTQILKANPGIKADAYGVGQKIFIPDPTPVRASPPQTNLAPLNLTRRCQRTSRRSATNTKSDPVIRLPP
jgi:tetratricopeptide (TPR) repeat protein